MSPLRRYLRITSSSVLEVRIYLDNPADVSRWLLNERDPVLPRVMQAVRPLVMPKLREENERNGTAWSAGKGRGGGRGGKRKGVRDLVVEEQRIDDFEVSIFLTELSTRHSILTKQKNFSGKGSKLRSNSGKMTGTREEPVEVGETGENIFIREESEETGKTDLENIPSYSEEDKHVAEPTEKRRQGSEEGLFLSDESDGGSEHRPTIKEKTDPVILREDSDVEDDKKKMALNTTYEGFSIYGRILCLVVKRRGTVKGKQLGGGAGQAMMEEWIASTQVGQGQIMEE